MGKRRSFRGTHGKVIRCWRLPGKNLSTLLKAGNYRNNGSVTVWTSPENPSVFGKSQRRVHLKRRAA